MEYVLCFVVGVLVGGGISYGLLMLVLKSIFQDMQKVLKSVQRISDGLDKELGTNDPHGVGRTMENVRKAREVADRVNSK